MRLRLREGRGRLVGRDWVLLLRLLLLEGVSGAAEVHDRQVRDPHQSVLAGEGEALIARLLLRKAADAVVAGVVHGDAAVYVDGEALGRWEVRIAQIVLCADGGGRAQNLRPPIAGLRRAGHEQADAAAGLELATL